MTTVAAETMAYQAYLEGHRADPDDEQLYEDLLKARQALEVAWHEARPLDAVWLEWLEAMGVVWREATQ